jgi:hypothetical protein
MEALAMEWIDGAADYSPLQTERVSFLSRSEAIQERRAFMG